MEKKKPLKRNKNIIPLSKEHHGTLLFGWKIRWGVHLNTPSERIAKYVKWFWENQLQPHQEEEDRLLFFDHSDSLVRKALDEHEIIYNSFQEIISGKKQDNETFLQLADFLEDHTRYEERVLFPHLENKLSEKQLNEIGEALESSGREHSAAEDYEDEFWKNKGTQN